jgi:hypothetical protein
VTDDLTSSEQRHFAMLARTRPGAPFTQDTVGKAPDEERSETYAQRRGHDLAYQPWRRLEAEQRWGPDPQAWPAWECSTCGQRNSGWCLECGRCQSGRFDNRRSESEIVKRYTSQEYADLQRICALYLGACNFGNEDVERRRRLCREIVSGG